MDAGEGPSHPPALRAQRAHRSAHNERGGQGAALREQGGDPGTDPVWRVWPDTPGFRLRSKKPKGRKPQARLRKHHPAVGRRAASALGQGPLCGLLLVNLLLAPASTLPFNFCFGAGFGRSFEVFSSMSRPCLSGAGQGRGEGLLPVLGSPLVRDARAASGQPGLSRPSFGEKIPRAWVAGRARPHGAS